MTHLCSRPINSAKRKPESHIPSDDDRDDEMEGVRHGFKRQRADQVAADPDPDSGMFLPMYQQPFHLLMKGGATALAFPMNAGYPFTMPAGYHTSVGIVSVPQVSATQLAGVGGNLHALSGASRLAIGASSPTSQSSQIGDATQSSSRGGNGGEGPNADQGSSNGGRREKGNRRRRPSPRGTGDQDGQGVDSLDGSDGDAESDGEEPANHRDKGKGRARPREQPVGLNPLHTIVVAIDGL